METFANRDMFGDEIIEDFRGKYFFLCNFYERSIVMHGITFPSTEHAYMWSKTLIQSEKDAILACKTPAQARLQGGPGMTTLRPGWEEELKFPTMRDVVGCKFDQHPDLARRLLDTGESMIIEGNWWHDNYWGDCRCGKNSKCEPTGRNHLGQIHEFHRERLRGVNT